jgi:predicted small lipoprotein YifL
MMNCWARYLLYLVITLLALSQMVVACGQKGPLYLPEKATEEPPAGSPSPADAPVPRDDRSAVPLDVASPLND